MASGEREFERLCLPELRAVYSYIASRVDPDDAEDVLQETLLSAWKSIGSFDRRSSVRTWLISVARRRICDFYRSRPVIRNGVDGGMISEAPRGSGEEAYDVDSGISLEKDSAERLDVSDALASLDESERELVTLVFDSGLSYEEAAGIVGIPVGTVKSRMFSIRKKLRSKLGEGYNEL